MVGQYHLYCFSSPGAFFCITGATIPEPSYNPHLLKAGKHPGKRQGSFYGFRGAYPFTPVRVSTSGKVNRKGCQEK